MFFKKEEIPSLLYSNIILLFSFSSYFTLFNVNLSFISNDKIDLESESICFRHDLPRISAPICPHLCIRHRLLRLNYHIASPHQSQIALCKKHLHRH